MAQYFRFKVVVVVVVVGMMLWCVTSAQEPGQVGTKFRDQKVGDGVTVVVFEGSELVKGGLITDERREGGSRCFSRQLLPNTHTLPVGARVSADLVPHPGELAPLTLLVNE